MIEGYPAMQFSREIEKKFLNLHDVAQGALHLDFTHNYFVCVPAKYRDISMIYRDVEHVIISVTVPPKDYIISLDIAVIHNSSILVTQSQCRI